MPRKLILLILDGWGIATQPEYSAIAQAKTPFINALYKHYPHSKLATSGLAVGLPKGQMGNSEVGHLNIGAGRTINQSLVSIHKAITSGELHHNKALLAAFSYAKKQQKSVHFMGLVSDGGIHAHIDHLKALCSMAQCHAVAQLFIHAFTDGRDTAPGSATQFLTALEQHLQNTTGQLASIMGRYYAMDRDQRWERIKVAYDALVHGQGVQTQDWRKALEQAYAHGITDEFLLPILLSNQKGNPRACIQEGDVVLCFNFRADRVKQLTQVLTQTVLQPYSMKPHKLHYLSMTVYDDHFTNVQPLFKKETVRNTLGEILSKHGRTQLRIAETEKYPHITYFFSGGREALFPGESRILCPSPKIATYDLRPAMAAWDITASVLPVLVQQSADFICLNFANPDMVGHTGVFEAAVQACEVVDQCVAEVVKKAFAHDYITLIISDHGNADKMCDHQGIPYTAHTNHLVPCILVDKHAKTSLLKDGRLANVAPTILQCMGLTIPEEMEPSLFSR